MSVVAQPDHHVETQQKVTPLELFFDLVFVFAITQVTALMAAEPTWAGLGKGMLVLSALWWAWASYSWLTNSVNALAKKVMLPVTVAGDTALSSDSSCPSTFPAPIAYARRQTT